MSVKFEENVYSFRAPTSFLHDGVAAGPPPGAATLASVEQLLASAHDAYVARRYGEALDDYKAAGAMIYGYLDATTPSVSPGLYGKLSKDARLFPSLLSVSAEYLNVLPLPSSPDVGPRVTPDAATLGEDRPAQIGIHSSEISSPTDRAAFADLEAAARLEALGLTTNAEFYSKRAAATAPELAQRLATIATIPGVEPAPGAGPGIGAQLEGGAVTGAASTHLPMSLRLARVAASGLAATRTSPADVARELRPGGLGGAGAPAGGGAASGGGDPAGGAAPATGNGHDIGALPSGLLEARSVGLATNGSVVQLSWHAGETPSPDALRQQVYESRVHLQSLGGDLLLHPQAPADIALSLAHYYYYVVPLGIAESLHALGDYAAAEPQYLQAAAYEFLNVDVEGPYLWLRLATLYLDWGDSLFKAGNPQDAAPVYANVIGIDGSVPAGHLYSTPALGTPTAVARQVIGAIADVSKLPATINPALIAAIVEVHQQLIKIQGGLDFWGSSANSVPIWTFDYLQSVAANFAQLAISAEKDFISYQERADQATVARENLAQTVATSQAEINAAQLQASAAGAEVTAYGDGVALANQRAADASTAVTDYSNSSWNAVLYQAASAQVQGGDDGNPDQLNQLADQLLSGHAISDSSATVAAATELAGAKASRNYEIGSLQRTASEMQAAATQAQAELSAAQARQSAANAAVTVAQLRASAAQAVLDDFDAAFFTPDVWHAMGQTMYRLYRRYFTMAQRVAQDMQKAYNFETDQLLHLVRSDYTSDEVNGLLAADALMADVQSFTYDLVTATAGKPQPVRHTISLASSYPYLFETQFRKTGVIEFETRVDDFDAAYPGAYAGRIEAVEVLVDGIVPTAGIAATLTNSGISTYRVPAAAWPSDGSAPGVKYRVQSKETLVVSDYDARADALMFTPENRMLRIFEGAGVASSWRLEVDRAVNDVDFGALTDVRLVFYYRARFDPGLRDRVLTHLTSLPGVTQRGRSLPLRWLYPDAFYHFQANGTLDFALAASDFPVNETQPKLSQVAVLVATDGTKPASGIQLAVSAPGKTPATAATDANGLAASNASAPLNALLGGTAIGSYSIAVPAAGNPGLASGGKLDLSPIVNVALLFEYEFTPRS